MKRILLALGVVALVGAAVAWSGPGGPKPDLDFRTQGRNPVTHLRLNNDPEEFQFAIVSDRTGGHRAKVFSRAVDRLNLLQPEFVVSVGDLIEGYTDDKEKLADQWKEFDGYVRKLQMPFFYVPGNHDVSNATQEKEWQEKFGRRYYHFVYRNVLFLLLSSEERTPKDEKNAGNRDVSKFSAKQIEYVKKVLADNGGVRWTSVSLHGPVWTIGNGGEDLWLGGGQLLEGRGGAGFA